MASIINTGISALNAFKRQMETTGHNIANVNTEGYSRQTVRFDTRPPESVPEGYIGSGVDVSSITRNYDNFLADRVRDYTSSHEEFSVYHDRASQIDNVIADASAGISGMLQQFFASVNDVADDPTSIPARSVMLSRADQLSDRFAALNGWFEDIRHQMNRELEFQVNEVNSISKSLADINARIANMDRAVGGVPNDILDERDRLIDELSRYTNVSTLEQSDGSMNVFVGTGQALVVGGTYNTLAVTNNPLAVDHKEIVIQQAGGLVVNVSQQITGGSLGGLLRFADEVLDESQNALGRVAIGLGTFFNAAHSGGMDLDGNPGSDFFSVAAPQVMANPANGGSISVAFDNVADLTTHEYQLDFDGAGWSLYDLDTGSNVALSGSGTVADPFVADGISIVVNAAAAGDSYSLRPTRLGASAFGVLVADEREIAAADPSGGVGDNRNARRLADLQTANLMMGGTASFANTYGALIADIGTKTQQAASNAGVQEHLLSQAEAAKSAVSGVNLDEEAANMIRFQQAYQAAAQVIAVAGSLFQTLLGAVGR